ncbi:hypothetical protein [Mycobacterium palustre]|uniref:hypothetical protein n=1 Tax=Mycobacterium palustre TaxID=153971 RepID=UPI00114D751F|nr:hypothetical protein [Mycobacterium palustre]MCV7101771.1 hypothetical protein [Mycobacterium palustre]
MIVRMAAGGLLAGSMGLLALAAGTGTAQAQPDTAAPPAPPIEELLTESLVTQTPSLFTIPADRGRPSEVNWDGVGMYCQNLYIKCG